MWDSFVPVFIKILLTLRKMGGKVSSPLWEPDPFWNQWSKLLDEIRKIEYESASLKGREKIRIVICACGKDGKSSTINNILAALSGTYSKPTNNGGQFDHVTQRYIEFKMLIGDSRDSTYVICDTPGLRETPSKEKQQLQIEAIRAAITGKFCSSDEMDYDKMTLEDLDKMTNKQNMADCVIFVIDSRKGRFGVIESMKPILQFVQSNNIITACLITKCDELDGDVKRNIRHIYYSIPVEEARSAIAHEFSGFPGDRIFPIVNYTESLTTTPDMRVQTLFALKHILGDILSRLKRRI